MNKKFLLILALALLNAFGLIYFRWYNRKSSSVEQEKGNTMITGKCFCGAIQYKIKADILKSGVCHCHACQRLTGGAAFPFIVVPQESLIIQGKPKEFTRPGASGKPVHVSFCGTCGSTLFGRMEAWPQMKIVGASSLDDRTLFSPDMYVWTEEAPKWVLFNPCIQKFDRNPNVK